MNKHAAIGCKKYAPTTRTVERPSDRGMIVPELLLLYHRETLRPAKPRVSKTARYRERLSATINPKPAACALRHSTTILSQSGRQIAGECLRCVSSVCLELFLRRTTREERHIGQCAESASQDRGSSRRAPPPSCQAAHARYRDAGCVFVVIALALLHVTSTPTPTPTVILNAPLLSQL